MTPPLTRQDVEAALPVLRAGQGWREATARVNQDLPAPVSERSLRRAMQRAGLLEAFPRRKGPWRAGRPRLPELRDNDFEFAVGQVERHGITEATRQLNRRRGVTVSRRWLRRALQARGWTPAPRPGS